MKDAKGHGSEKRGGGGKFDETYGLRGGTPIGAPARPGAKFSRRKQRGGGGGGTSSGGSGGGSASGGGSGGSMQKHKQQGAHTSGIHRALKMNLAQLSAAATNPNIPPPIIGGRK